MVTDRYQHQETYLDEFERMGEYIEGLYDRYKEDESYARLAGFIVRTMVIVNDLLDAFPSEAAHRLLNEAERLRGISPPPKPMTVKGPKDVQ